MFVDVTRTTKQTTRVEIQVTVGSMKELREIAIEEAQFQLNNHDYIEHETDGQTFKIIAIV